MHPMRQWDSCVWQRACPREDVREMMKVLEPLAWDHETLVIAWVTWSTIRFSGQHGSKNIKNRFVCNCLFYLFGFSKPYSQISTSDCFSVQSGWLNLWWLTCFQDICVTGQTMACKTSCCHTDFISRATRKFSDITVVSRGGAVVHAIISQRTHCVCSSLVLCCPAHTNTGGVLWSQLQIQWHARSWEKQSKSGINAWLKWQVP